MGMLIAAPGRIHPVRTDRAQLLLTRPPRVLDVSMTDALMLRVARHAGTAEDLLLRFADIARCPPDAGWDNLKRGIAQGWLIDLASTLESLDWRLPDAGTSTSEVARDAATFETLRAANTHTWLAFGSLGRELRHDPGTGNLIISQHLAGLQPAHPLRFESLVDLPGLLSALSTTLLAGASGDSPVLAESEFVHQLLRDGSWLGVCLHDQQRKSSPQLPGPVISDARGCVPGAGCLMVLRGAHDLPPLTEAMAPAYGELLRLLHPRGKVLHVPVHGYGQGGLQTRDTPGLDAAMRLALACLPTGLPDLDLEFRRGQLVLHLQSLARSEDEALGSLLTATWLRRWAEVDDWAAVYGLHAGFGEQGPPRLERAELASVRRSCAEYVEALLPPATQGRS